jgi:lipopolysaccharide export system protein LptA
VPRVGPTTLILVAYLTPERTRSAQKTHLRTENDELTTVFTRKPEGRSPKPTLKYTNLQMPSNLSRLRRWFAGATIAAILLVAGTYFYARHRIQNALQQVPAKIGLEIKQSATGFTVSKSEQGRTLFTIQASKAVQFKQGGHAELHDVQITLYGSDSSRFDQIRGADFEYDQQTGNVIAKGDVQIDLQSNPEGLLNPDQSPPTDLKNPIHLKTSGLIFNQNTGDAHTKQRVDFDLPQGSGSAVGVNYAAKANVLTLQSQVNLAFSGATAATITAVRGTITKDPHHVVLDHPHVQSGARQCDADEATLFLRSDNSVDRVLARGNVLVRAEGSQPAEARSEQLELMMAKQHDTLRTAIFSGNVQTQIAGNSPADSMEDGRPRQSNPSATAKLADETPKEWPMQGKAGRIVLEFASKNFLNKVHAEDHVKLLQHQNPVTTPSGAQDLELTAQAMDFFMANDSHAAEGSHLDRAETSGATQITIRPAAGSGQQTLVTAAKFDAHFDSSGQFTSVHGEPDARIVSQNPGEPDRVSTSRVVDATFQPGSGIQSIVQQGRVTYVDGERQAWGDRARYTPADQVLILTGSPRVTDGGMTTTANSMRLNRATGDAFAEGDVKTTYSDLKPQPGGALLSSSNPIHVTARSMSVHGTSAIALYTGEARLWQDANAVEAQSIEFNRDRRSMVAVGSATSRTVSTVLVQGEKSEGTSEPSTPIAITSTRLTYADNERKAHFDGDVTAKEAEVTITAKKMDAFLEARGGTNHSLSGAGKLDKIVAQEQVVITQPDRRATGDLLTYTAADDKFVLTGGPPSIFDAEHGKITGVSLTFFRHDDRVLVEGNNSSPTVTQTRVAR